MLLPDRSDPDYQNPPGLVGALNPAPPARDRNPPLPATPEETTRTAALLRLAMFVALLVWMIATDARELPPEWVLALVSIALLAIPDKALGALIPPSVRRRLERSHLSPKPAIVQADSGDTWITRVPTVRTHETERTTIRLPFRVLAGLGALFGVAGTMLMDGGVPLTARVCMLLFGTVFGGFALVPDGDLRRMLPRISPPGTAAPGDADAGQGQSSSRTGSEHRA